MLNSISTATGPSGYPAHEALNKSMRSAPAIWREHTPKIIAMIIDEIPDDKDGISTLCSLSLASKLWTRECRKRLFNEILVFKGAEYFVRFMQLASVSLCTFQDPAPYPSKGIVKCKYVEFGCTPYHGHGTDWDYFDFTTLPETMQNATAFLDVEQGAIIHASDEGIPPAVRAAFQKRWSIKCLKLFGGKHSASVLFEFLYTLPDLELLCLTDVRLDERSFDHDTTEYAFPPAVRKLSICSSEEVWLFLQSRVAPGGGLEEIEEVQVRDDFMNGDMLLAMSSCFKQMPRLQMVSIEVHLEKLEDLDFRLTYRKRTSLLRSVPRGSPNLIDVLGSPGHQGLFHFLRNLEFPASSGLKKLRLNLTQFPPPVAAKCISDIEETDFAAHCGIELLEVHMPEYFREFFDLEEMRRCTSGLNYYLEGRYGNARICFQGGQVERRKRPRKEMTLKELGEVRCWAPVGEWIGPPDSGRIRPESEASNVMGYKEFFNCDT
ncbi:hypothetical protein NMY22_g5088 [Coprinellus aureogranulatus]|nr:hypothetical protein NMY22_g5088 [Coprinellus aureogranulatus]